MQRITDISREQSRINAGSKPCAQYTTLCQQVSKHDQLLQNVIHVIINGPSGRIMERMLLDLMLSGGLRISEALNDPQLKVNALGQVYVRGLKGSHDKLVTPIYFRNYWSQKAMQYAVPFINVSRFIMYKFCKQNGISLSHSGKKNKSVTHAMRHLHVYMLELMAVPPTELSSILGHKSMRNLKYYTSGRDGEIRN